MQNQPSRLSMHHKFRHLSVLILSSLLLTIKAAPLLAEVVIAPHRAAYKLELKRTRRDSRVSEATGAMVYTWGETCDGWLVDQQFVLNVVRGDGNVMQLAADSSTWESKDGTRLRFNIKRERNGQEVEKIRGEARLDGENGAGVAVFEMPKPARIKLPKGTVFPTMHTLRLMRRAAEGAKVDRQLVFDGSELEPPGFVSAFILPLKNPKNQSEVILPPLWRQKVRKINLAFFSALGKAPEPEFEMLIALQDNGIASSLVLDYGDYAVRGTLARLKALKKPDC
jgi:hypothetical protein